MKERLLFFIVFFFITFSCLGWKKENIKVTMRDGTKLSTDVFLPEEEGSWPVILVRTPYNKNNLFNNETKVFLKNGYAVVIQDTRGRFESEGKNYAFLFDAKDGYDTIEWISRQRWCNGDVGTYGGSAMGITQYLAGAESPPHLKCQLIIVATPSLYHTIYQGGAFRKSLVTAWLAQHGFDPEFFKLIITHSEYDGFWQEISIIEEFNKYNVPVLHITGWFDIFLQDTINAFNGINKKGGSNARGKQKIIIGPWAHAIGDNSPGELLFPDNASEILKEYTAVDWFNYCIKGENNKFADLAPVNYYVMGDTYNKDSPGNKWEKANDFENLIPIKKLYLHNNFVGNNGSNRRGKLGLDVPKEEKGQKSFIFDPTDPVPTKGGNNLNIMSGPFDQKDVEERDDVLIFESDLLQKPVEVTGKIDAILYVSTDCMDTDITVKLTDVYPDGKSMLVTDGIVRLGRTKEGKKIVIEPGKVYEVKIDLWSTSKIFNKGHKIRIDISSSNFPRFDVNYNTGSIDLETDNEIKMELSLALIRNWKPVKKKKIWKKATNTIYFNSKYPSYIALPWREL